MFNDNAQLLRGRVTMVSLKGCNLTSCSKILEQVQLDVRKVTISSFSRAEIGGYMLLARVESGDMRFYMSELNRVILSERRKNS
jgi:hypothetical protein